MPNRIYIVDRQRPKVTVVVTPAPYKDEERTKPYIYQPGETITVEWVVCDANLDQRTITLGLAFAKFPNNLVFMEIPEALKPRGSLAVEIPREAAGQGGILLRVKATDKAGNVGLGSTDVLHVAPLGEFPPYEQPTVPPEAPAAEPPEVPVEPAEPGDPTDPIELTNQEGEPAETPQADAVELETDAPPPRPLFLPEANTRGSAELSLADDPVAPSKLPALAHEAQAVVARIRPGRPDRRPEAPVVNVNPAEEAEPVVLASNTAMVDEPTTQPAEGTPPRRHPGARSFVPTRWGIPTSAEAREVDPFDLIHQTQGTPGEKLGWPRAGAMIRGGAKGRLLGWLPVIAAKYRNIELQFSYNRGSTWRTVAKDLRFGQATARWDVPMVTSKQCYLRIVGADEKAKRILLAISPRFTVDTVVEGTTIGPLPIEPQK